MTIIEALSHLNTHSRVNRMATWAALLPEEIRNDERFTRAFARRLKEIKEVSHHYKEQPNVRTIQAEVQAD